MSRTSNFWVAKSLSKIPDLEPVSAINSKKLANCKPLETIKFAIASFLLLNCSVVLSKPPPNPPNTRDPSKNIRKLFWGDANKAVMASNILSLDPENRSSGLYPLICKISPRWCFRNWCILNRVIFFLIAFASVMYSEDGRKPHFGFISTAMLKSHFGVPEIVLKVSWLHGTILW